MRRKLSRAAAAAELTVALAHIAAVTIRSLGAPAIGPAPARAVNQRIRRGVGAPSF